jgi:hypothetical protein
MGAELALAAYASLTGGVATNSQIDALQEAGMTRTQAEEFARNLKGSGSDCFQGPCTGFV